MLVINDESCYGSRIMTKILVFGKNGQIARALQKVLTSDAEFLGHDIAQFEKPEGLHRLLDEYQPQIIINTAAYTAVDKAETEKDLCFTINAEAPKQMAQWAKAHEALLIHFSTDYVYGGNGELPQTEKTSQEPLNVYGASKKAGEEYIRESGARHIILRTSWVYDEEGTNFVRTMLRLGAEREELKVVCDQIGSPSYAKALAAAVQKILGQNPGNIRETYNICGQGFVSWQKFAQEIFKQAAELGFKLKIQSVLPIKTEEYKTAALRPLNSRMNQEKIKNEFGIELPPWQESLRECLEEIRSK